MTSIQDVLEQKLHKIHRSRNRLGYLPNLLAYFFALYFLQGKLFLGHLWIWTTSLVLGGTILRIIVGEFFFEDWSKHLPLVRFVNIFAFTILGLGWGLHFYDVHSSFGQGSMNVSYSLLILVAFITGASTSLVADTFSYLSLVLSITISVLVTYVFDPHFTNTYIIFNVILFLLFSVSNYRISHRQLLELLNLQMKETKEKERLGQIINAVPGRVGLLDQELNVYMTNQETLELYPDILGKKIGTIDQSSEWETIVKDFMSSHRKAGIFEIQTKITGEVLHGLLNIQKTEDEGAIIVAIDTTPLIVANTKLREQEAKAQHSANLASLGEMAAGIAHEINNPLTIIQGAANIISKLSVQEPVDTSSLALLTEKIVETTNRISKTVRSLKALSRNAENDPKVEVSITQVIDYCVDAIGQRLKLSDVELRLNDYPKGLKILGREVQLCQVLLNLINNSNDAVKNLEEKWIELRILSHDGMIDIFVIDSGVGIPVSFQQKIMEPFFTTKEVNQGTGLGLSISKNIIRDFGGELVLLTDESHTTFKVRLPGLI